MSIDALRRAFLRPGDEYSPLPFWFINDDLTREELRRQIHDFHAKGVASFVIHPRKGLPKTIPYLSDRYMDFIRFAVEEAERLSMRVVLYDEAMYPSGSAHGMVVRENPAYASRCLRMQIAEGGVLPTAAEHIAVCEAILHDGRAGEVRVLQPDADGLYRAGEGKRLLAFSLVCSGGTIRGVHEHEDDGEPDAPASADLLSPDAVRAFIRLTHERYYAALARHFGKTVVAMFTDEPDITGRNSLPGGIAWTGEITPAGVDGEGRYALRLGRRESIILCVSRDLPVTAASIREAEPEKAAQPLAGVRFAVAPLDGSHSAFALVTDGMGRLPSWTEQPGLAHYSGFMAYEAELPLDRPAVIDLGACSGITRAYADGQALGLRMWGPHTYALPAGMKKLRIEVCNTPANARERAVLPSGMLGPVTLTR